MTDNPYTILGVSPKADPAEIKAAFRRIARASHPDLSPGDRSARARFEAAAQAYELLRDATFRARYDRGEINAQGLVQPRDRPEPPAATHPMPGHAPPPHRAEDDPLAGLFGGPNAQGGFGSYHAGADRADSFDLGGADLHCRLEVAFTDIARGGTGQITLPDGRALSLRIPEGARDGQVLRLRGKGHDGPDQTPPGDALVTLSVRPHALFQRIGNDILIVLPITLDEAILGARVPVPTLDGRVQMTVPKGAATGRRLRLRGQGIRPMRGGERGDLLVELQIVLPAGGHGDPADYVRDWRDSHIPKLRG